MAYIGALSRGAAPAPTSTATAKGARAFKGTTAIPKAKPPSYIAAVESNAGIIVGALALIGAIGYVALKGKKGTAAAA